MCSNVSQIALRKNIAIQRSINQLINYLSLMSDNKNNQLYPQSIHT